MIQASQQQFIASVFGVRDLTDPTKLMQFDVSAIATGTTRTITMPNAAVDLTRLTAVAGTAEANKALVVDGSKNIAGIGTFSSTGAITWLGASTADWSDDVKIITLKQVNDSLKITDGGIDWIKINNGSDVFMEIGGDVVFPNGAQIGVSSTVNLISLNVGGIIVNGSVTGGSLVAQGIMTAESGLISKGQDGGDVSLRIRNESGAGSSNETVSLLFGTLAGNENVAKIVGIRTNNWNINPNKDGGLQFYTTSSATETLALTIDENQDLILAEEMFLVDSKKIYLGNTNTDLQIFSDGTNGIIDVATALRLGNNVTNYTEISSTGDIVFAGSAGLVYGGISAVENAVETAIGTAGIKVQVTIFDRNMPSNNITSDHTQDHTLITKAGDYKIVVSATVNSIGGAGSVMEFEVMKNNGASRLGHLHADRTLGGGGTERGSISLSDIVTLAAPVAATRITYAFVDSNPDTITDSSDNFVEDGFAVGQTLTIAGSTSNDGDYTIDTVAIGTLTLIAADTLFAEDLADTITATGSETVELWIENETNTQNYIVEDVTIQVIQLGG